MSSIPKPYLLLYLALSAFLNILGIASIVDGVVAWVGFAAHIVATYRAYIREPILHALSYAWPAAWWQIPGWLIDLLVIQSSFFISHRLFLAFEKEQHLLTFGEVRVFRPVVIFLGGPLVSLMQLLRLRKKAAYEIELAQTEAEAGEEAEQQYARYGDTNLQLLSEAGWSALEKRQLAGLQALEASKATYVKLSLYYACYVIFVVVMLFVAHQISHARSY